MPPRPSPLPNRVAPDGSLVATRARGLFMGNRGGRFHDAATAGLGRRQPWSGKAWICCRLDFKDRTSPPGGVWGGARYTELFFCDEVTALAAGHRPCMECRRADALAWRAAVARAGLAAPGARFPTLDERLHAERLDGRAKRLHRLAAEGLPDGAVIRADDGTAVALRGDAALVWSPAGYAGRLARPRGPVSVLTPPTSLAALGQGYEPAWHPSAA
ncbi:MAG: hypothetical protein U1E62_04490 [Alsobacter sp.]